MRYHDRVRVALLTARPDLEVNRRFSSAASELGVELETVDVTAVCSVVGHGRRRLATTGALDAPPDAVLARIGNWRPESALAVLEGLVGMGAATPNPPEAIRTGRDHWATLRVLAAAGLPVPETVAGADPEALAAAAERHLGLPVVVKQRRSRMGVGVIRCAGRDHLEAVLDSLWRLGDEVIVQRWLEGGESSLRLLAVDGTVVAAARLRAAPGEWRSNAARGAAAEAHCPSEIERELAVAAAEALGLGHCGVDLLDSPEGPVVAEVNPTPGFLRLEAATGFDVARALLASAVRRGEAAGCG